MSITASPDDQALLLELQALDTALAQLNHRAKNIPQLATLTVLGEESAAARLLLAEHNGGLDDLKSELSRVESDVDVVQTRITRDSNRLQTSSSVKDVAALEQELAALRKRLYDLEEIELAVMERLEQQQSAVDETSARLADLTAKTTEVEVERDAALSALNAERTVATTARHDLQSAIPADLLALYEKQRGRYGMGASLLRGGVSLASGVKLLENEMQAIRAAAPDEVILCSSSEAILVRTSESGLQ
ncbi:MAG: zinc ribbon domain-containing protein [Rhodoglobus sp.]